MTFLEAPFASKKVLRGTFLSCPLLLPSSSWAWILVTFESLKNFKGSQYLGGSRDHNPSATGGTHGRSFEQKNMLPCLTSSSSCSFHRQEEADFEPLLIGTSHQSFRQTKKTPIRELIHDKGFFCASLGCFPWINKENSQVHPAS